MSRVRCHLSGILCQVFCVRCHMSYIYFFYKVVELVGGGSVINGAYPVQFMKKVKLPFCPDRFMKEKGFISTDSLQLLKLNDELSRQHCCQSLIDPLKQITFVGDPIQRISYAGLLLASVESFDFYQRLFLFYPFWQRKHKLYSIFLGSKVNFCLKQ